jgi:transcription factor WhiB
MSSDVLTSQAPVEQERGDWRDQALCAQDGMDPELWHYSGMGLVGVGHPVALARHLCVAHCPVLWECGQWARGKTWRGTCVAGRIHKESGGISSTQPIRATCPICWPERTNGQAT